MKDRDLLGTYKQNVYKSKDSRTERSGLHRQMRKGQCKKEKKSHKNKTKPELRFCGTARGPEIRKSVKDFH